MGKPIKSLLLLIAIYIIPNIIVATLGFVVIFSKPKFLIKADNTLIKLIGVIGLVALFSGLLNGEALDYYYFRTLYYYYQLVGLLLVGRYLAINYSIKMLLKNIATAGLIITFFLYFDFIISFRWITSPFSLINRYEFGLNSEFALITYLICQVKDLKISRKYKITSLLLILISLSRTYILIVLMIFIYNKLSSIISIKKTIILVGSIGILIFSQIDSNSHRFDDDPTNASIFDKFAYSIIELAPSDADNLRDINANYRGYEVFLAVNDVIKTGLYKSIYGRGAGRTISIEAFDEKAQNMSFFHNGFVTIFFHAGFIGVIFYLIFLYKIYKTNLQFGKNYASALLIFILIYTSSSMGLISPIANYLMILIISLGNYSNFNKSSTLL